MRTAFQPSLLDAAEGPDTTEGWSLGALADGLERVDLAHGAWLDVRRGWLRGSAGVMAHLVGTVPWRAEERRMYDRVVTVPRLLAWYGPEEPWPHPALTAAREALDAHYGLPAPQRVASAGLCWYRDGRDGVAWHGDRIGRSRHEDVLVGILSVGEPRALALRPVDGGGPTLRFPLGHGDLLVMGGSCQRTWDHCVPKTARPVGPRISVQLRPRGVA
ncbi:alpha-ketoglutarate-dependent dioxygenase AlkB [Aquipuribacter nitratireducens]|uniref:Alpha-ketoglutarate-dependent dioxygenase AlkB n=1 Tax=Aquipuribacter nitratireducens TaxID=650104 RepID=A0ABW0GMS5_9MICO